MRCVSHAQPGIGQLFSTSAQAPAVGFRNMRGVTCQQLLDLLTLGWVWYLGDLKVVDGWPYACGLRTKLSHMELL
jgi:hypothetical protein